MEVPLIVERFERAVRDNPDAPAVETADRTVGYREFGKLTDELADGLSTRVAPGEFVGIDATKGLGAITAMMAALKAGRPFVFLDSSDSDSSNARKVSLLGVRLVVDADGTLTDAPSRWRGTAQARAVGDPEIGYAIHTSGSTGEPKCVLVRTGPLAAVIDDHVRRLEVGPGSRTLQFARLTFDGCITEILWTLTSGACLVVLDSERLAPGAELRDTLELYGITHLKTTPFALTATTPTNAMRLEHVINGGGACRPAVVTKWSAVADFHNAYGTTETSICNLLSGPLRADDCRAGVPLGGIVGDCDYHLRDGEIVITGNSVGVGYLTDEGVQPFNGKYRTGDIAELRDGELYFVERLDRQVKVRGYRLDPGEIENAMCAADSVTEAVVTVESHDGTQDAEPDALVGYYVGDADPRTLRGHLDEALDPYKVPSVLNHVESVPYTPNGKVDRDALRKSRHTDTEGESAPDERVLGVVRGLTGVQDAGLDDNFFDIGGDSASALALVDRMREFGWTDAGVRDVLRAPDLRALAKQLHERSG